MKGLVEGLQRDEALTLLGDALAATRAVAERQRAVLSNVELVDSAFEQAVALLFLAEEREAAIIRAMLRVANDEYGRCEWCGGPIDADHLRARPDALHCTEHQAPRDRGHRP